ncbi:hypothetical protein [Desulfonema magnum]|uniref:Uncharacterized protein n=1 Tax=Desulfonema magnum TaxID=45655 RepID=A0A975BNX4_9BACT|nr:hypothetical protein [Desulfonema magnum]QTA88668.1 Uncharacterized protein dnm_047150 [Desulfonema magnum]
MQDIIINGQETESDSELASYGRSGVWLRVTRFPNNNSVTLGPDWQIRTVPKELSIPRSRETDMSEEELNKQVRQGEKHNGTPR